MGYEKRDCNNLQLYMKSKGWSTTLSWRGFWKSSSFILVANLMSKYGIGLFESSSTANNEINNKNKQKQQIKICTIPKMHHFIREL